MKTINHLKFCTHRINLMWDVYCLQIFNQLGQKEKDVCLQFLTLKTSVGRYFSQFFFRGGSTSSHFKKEGCQPGFLRKKLVARALYTVLSILHLKMTNFRIQRRGVNPPPLCTLLIRHCFYLQLMGK